ncbi:hypothetical protein IAD21_00941 [Abditibacteriota bacterium]|nr:hypothetical protein IAD21_00941 [Abditibacteriota bacterium]
MQDIGRLKRDLKTDVPTDIGPEETLRIISELIDFMDTSRNNQFNAMGNYSLAEQDAQHVDERLCFLALALLNVVSR